jgi:hypothetical protein
MKTRNAARRIRFPAPRGDGENLPIKLVLDEEEEAPCSEYVVMSQEGELPALQEYLRERGSRTIH